MIRALALVAALAAFPVAAQTPASGPSVPPPPKTPPASAPAGAGPDVGPRAPARADGAEKTLPRGAVLEEVVGTVIDVDWQKHQVVVDTGGTPVTLRLDRNSLVYGPRGLTTVLDVTPGAQIRAGRNADSFAYWIQLRTPRAAPTSTPGQGTGPGGGSGAPAEGGAGAPAPGTTVAPGGMAPSTGAMPAGAGQ